MASASTFLPLAMLGAPASVASADLASGAAQCIAPHLAKDAEVVLLSMHGGAGARPDFYFDGIGHPPRVVSVEGNGTGRPIVLVLSAHEPTIWDVSGVPAGRLRAVLAYGDQPQGVSGARKGVPIAFGGTDMRGATRGCGLLAPAYTSASVVEARAATLERRLGLRLSRFFGGYQPIAYHVDGGAPTAPPAPVPLSSVVSPDVLKPLNTIWTDEQVANWIRPGDLRYNIVSQRVAWSQDGSRVVATEADVANGPTASAKSISDDHRIVVPRGDFRTDGGLDLLLGLLSIGAAGAFAVALWRAHRDGTGAVNRTGRPDTARMIVEEAAFDVPQFRNVCEREWRDDRTSIAWVRFQQASSAVARLSNLDHDLADEARTIMGPRFDQLSGSLDRAIASGGGGEQVELPFRTALDLLTERLVAISAAQAKRNVDTLHTNSRFIASRYPGAEPI